MRDWQKHDDDVIEGIKRLARQQADRQQVQAGLPWWPLLIVAWGAALVVLMVAFIRVSEAGAAEIRTYDQLADAIYWAEGGPKAKKPYGILSVPCSGHDECRRICINTIRNNVWRFKDWGHREYDSYLEFLASRYAPIGAGNDPGGLNVNWLKNVRWFLANPQEVRQ